MECYADEAHRAKFQKPVPGLVGLALNGTANEHMSLHVLRHSL